MAATAGVGLVYDKRMLAHANPWDPDHPEQPARLTAIMDRLESAGVLQRCVYIEAREAMDHELASVHTKEHINLMRDVSSKAYGKEGRKSLARHFNSIYFNEGSSESALLAAGSVVEIALRVARGELAAGAAVVRPPGHHAESNGAMGFCLFNNVAIAAHVLVHDKKELGVRKVLIVDWDVHHGNGTQHMFWRDPQVLYFSVHRYDKGRFYPGGDEGDCDMIGEGDGLGFNINVPWPHGGFGDTEYLAVWDHLLMPVAREYNPDIVLISAGFDAADGDPLGGCRLTPYGYSYMTHKLMDLADGRVILALEGGYNLNSIANCYLACVQMLLKDPIFQIQVLPRPFPETWTLIQEVREGLKKFWSVLRKGIDVVEMQLSESSISLNEDQSKDLSAHDLSVEEQTLINIEHNTKKVDEDASFTNENQSSSSTYQPLTDVINKMTLLTTESTNMLNGDYEMVRGASSILTVGEGIATDDIEHEMGIVGENFVHANVKVENPDCGIVPFFSTKLESEYVWYASYGSNMWEARFMCYLQGGQVDGMADPCAGSRCQNPPAATDWLLIPHELFFGHSYSSTWGLGGVAFLDLTSKEGVLTHARLYKIKLQQFNDILIQENMGDPSSCHELVTPSVVDALCKGLLPPLFANYDEIYKDAWYGTVLYLGEKDDLPILTITCSPSQLKMFKSGLLPVTPPNDKYQQAIARGLVEHGKLSEENALAYISSKSILNI